MRRKVAEAAASKPPEKCIEELLCFEVNARRLGFPRPGDVQDKLGAAPLGAGLLLQPSNDSGARFVGSEIGHEARLLKYQLRHSLCDIGSRRAGQTVATDEDQCRVAVADVPGSSLI